MADSDQSTHEPSGLPPPFWTHHLRREFQVGLDLAVLFGAFWFAYLLRFDFAIPSDQLFYALAQAPWVVLIQLAAILFAGIYRYIWRYVGLAELRGFALAAVVSAAPVLMMRLGLPDDQQIWRVPISVALIDTALAFGGMIVLRVLRRLLYERYESGPREVGRRAGARQRTLLVGAGQAGLMAARELSRQPSGDLEVVGFVDDAEQKQNASIAGFRILGKTGDLERIVAEHRIEQVVITMTRADRRVLRSLLDTCERLGIRARIVPGLYEILEGRINVSRFREVQIEDLLGREPVRLDDAAVQEEIEGSTVLVSGAGGSIGAELARQVARYAPARLVLVDRAEPPLFEVDQALRALWRGLEIVPVVADCGDVPRMGRLLVQHQPRLVLHAAAHKHVPLMELNAVEAVANNSLMTYRFARAASEAGIERFVLVSTDKAVWPTSVMGATKRLAEVIVQHLGSGSTTRFMAVRFGNVMGSTGSVIPTFRRQIETGGPLTVTHPEMERYFMTIPEAAQLVLHAATLGAGGEIFVLDMGEPVKILELALDMIRLGGLVPHQDIEIVFTGPRPGEKLRESLSLKPADLVPTAHPKIFIGKVPLIEGGVVDRLIGELSELVERGDEAAVRRFLADALPEANLHAKAVTRPIVVASTLV